MRRRGHSVNSRLAATPFEPPPHLGYGALCSSPAPTPNHYRYWLGSSQSSTVIVIHIGLPKSGSTAIQSYLSANEEALGRLSIDYPPIGRLNRKAHHRLVHELKGYKKKLDPQGGTILDLAERCSASGSHLTILSSEMFEQCEENEIRTLRKTLVSALQPFRIILIVRDLVELVPSSYAQKIRYGHKTCDFDEFFEERIAERRANFFSTAEMWGKVFGWNRVKVRLLDRNALLNGDLLDDFLTTAGVDISDPEICVLPRPGRVNEANGWKVLEAIRALGADQHGLDKDHPLLLFLAKSDRNFDRKLVEAAAIDIGTRLGWMHDKGRYLTRTQAQRALDLYRTNVKALNERLSEKLPEPLDLDARGFLQRDFLPVAGLLAAAELRAFYDGIWSILVQRRRIARMSDQTLQIEPT